MANQRPYIGAIIQGQSATLKLSCQEVQSGLERDYTGATVSAVLTPRGRGMDEIQPTAELDVTPESAPQVVVHLTPAHTNVLTPPVRCDLACTVTLTGGIIDRPGLTFDVVDLDRHAEGLQ